MPVDPQKNEDDFAAVADQDVNDQLSDPENDVADGYLEKRTIHAELNSPLARAMRRYEGTGETVTDSEKPVKKEPVKEGIPTAEEEALQEPWIDPVAAGAGGFGGVFKTGLSLGARLAPTLYRAVVAGGVAAVADIPIGAVTEKVGEKHPTLALPFNVLTGMISGATGERALERVLEKAVTKYFTKKGAKPAQALIKESVETVRKNITAGKADDAMTMETVAAIENAPMDPQKVAEAFGVKYDGTGMGQATFTTKAGDTFTVPADKVSLRSVKEAMSGGPKSDIEKLMARRRGKLVEIKDVKEKTDRFLNYDVPQLPEKAININFARIDSEDDIKAVLAKTAEVFSSEINIARRGVRSNEQTEKVADMMSMSVEQLLSRRKGEAFNAETAVAARKMMVSSAVRLKELAEKVAMKEATDLDKFAFQKQLSIHYAIQAEVSGMTAEAGRALQSFRIQAKEGAGALKQIDEAMRGFGAKGFKDPATGKNIRPEDIADIIVSVDSVEGLNVFARQIRKATTFDMVMEVWINSLLSGPQTHAVNTLSNMLTAVWQIPERALAAKIGRYLPGPQEIREKEALHQAYGLVEGFKDGLKAFGKNMITGDEPDQFTKMDLPQRRAIAAQNFGLEDGSMAARAVDLLGEGIRLPTRFLGAEDAFFKSVGYRMELRARSYRQAAEEGLEGAALSKRVAEIMADPPDDIKLGAIDSANYQTFTRELGQVGRAGMKFLSKAPALRLVIPFVRTPANIVKFMGERTPLAIASKGIRAEIAAGGARRDLALARISMGSMVMATAATFTAAGMITGGGPEDHKLKNALRNTGWAPYSIKIGEKYYGYNRLEPLGMLLGVAADATEIMGQVGEEDAKTLATAAVMAFAKNVTSKTWLKGASDAIHAMDDPVRYGERFIQNYAKSLIPTGIAQWERINDPTLRSIYSPDGFWHETYNAIKSRVPGWSKTLPPRRNLWGRVIAFEPGFGPDIASPIYTSTVRLSPIDSEMVRLKYVPGMPKETQKILDVDVTMTAKEYDQYMVVFNNEILPRTGRNLKDSMDFLVTKDPMYKQMDDDDRVSMIRRYVADAKKLANGPMGIYMKNFKIRQDVDEARFSLQREARQKQ